MIYQRTIETPIQCSGRGVHSGKLANIRLLPAGVDTGIKFIRTDLKENNEILAQYPNVASQGYSTAVTNKHGVFVNTIEHLMSALWFLNVTNIIIEIDSEEMPIMDGSAEYFLFVVEAAGVVPQEGLIKTLEITKELEVTEKDTVIKVKPNKNGLKIEFLLDYPGGHPLLSKSLYSFDSAKNNFRHDVARARTFAPLDQIMYLRSINKTCSATMLNGVAITPDGIANPEKPRYINEPARHKVLDCIGDFYLSGYHINGHFECSKSGHQTNLKIIGKILESQDNYTIIAHG